MKSSEKTPGFERADAIWNARGKKGSRLSIAKQTPPVRSLIDRVRGMFSKAPAHPGKRAAVPMVKTQRADAKIWNSKSQRGYLMSIAKRAEPTKEQSSLIDRIGQTLKRFTRPAEQSSSLFDVLRGSRVRLATVLPLLLSAGIAGGSGPGAQPGGAGIGSRGSEATLTSGVGAGSAADVAALLSAYTPQERTSYPYATTPDGKEDWTRESEQEARTEAARAQHERFKKRFPSQDMTDLRPGNVTFTARGQTLYPFLTDNFGMNPATAFRALAQLGERGVNFDLFHEKKRPTVVLSSEGNLTVDKKDGTAAVTVHLFESHAKPVAPTVVPKAAAKAAPEPVLEIGAHAQGDRDGPDVLRSASPTPEISEGSSGGSPVVSENSYDLAEALRRAKAPNLTAPQARELISELEAEQANLMAEAGKGADNARLEKIVERLEAISRILDVINAKAFTTRVPADASTIVK